MIQNIPSIMKRIASITSYITGLYLRKHESIRNTTPTVIIAIPDILLSFFIIIIVTAIRITTVVTMEATSTCINLSFSFHLSLQLLF